MPYLAATSCATEILKSEMAARDGGRHTQGDRLRVYSADSSGSDEPDAKLRVSQMFSCREPEGKSLLLIGRSGKEAIVEQPLPQ